MNKESIMHQIALLSALLFPLLITSGFSQDKDGPNKEERAFLKKLEGDWGVSKVFVNGIQRKSPDYKLRFTKDSAAFVDPMVEEPALWNYENIDPKKMVVHIVHKEKELTLRYAVELAGDSLRCTTGFPNQSEIPKQTKPGKGNFSLEFLRVEVE